MKTYFPFILLALLTLWVATTAIRIERLNAQAGFYLPRDAEADGKWRQSQNNTPRDRLRVLVGGIGLLQYPLAPFALALSWSLASRPQAPVGRAFVILCGGVAAVCLGLALYRGYLPSLGW